MRCNGLRIALVIACFGLSPARGDPVSCVGEDLASAKTAQSDASGTLQSTIHYLDGSDPDTIVLVKKWFGSDDGTTVNNVRGLLSRALQFVNTVDFYCLYDNDGLLVREMSNPDGTLQIKDFAGKLLGYVNPADMSRVYLGLAFYAAPPVGFKSKLGTIVHEVTHYWLVGPTDDIYYGYDKSLSLATSDPSKAAQNADNYSYFVEDWLGLSKASSQ